MIRLLAALSALALFLACADAASAQVTSAKAAAAKDGACTAQPAVAIDALKVEPCTRDALEQEVVGQLSNYYGQVAMDVSGGGKVVSDKGLGRALRLLFKVEGQFTAAVSVSLYSSKDALIYERALFTIDVAKNDTSSISVHTTSGNDIDISPIFLLERGKESVSTRLKVSLVNTQTSGALDTLKAGVDAASALGGHGWLVTAITEPTFMAAAARVEKAIVGYYSQSRTLTTDTYLKYTGAKAFKSVTQTITIPVGKNQQPVVVTVTVYLKAFPSLVSDETTEVNGVPRPKVTGGAGPGTGRWADKIILSQNPDTRLGDYIDKSGVPRSVSELKELKPDAATKPISPADVVNSACIALKRAVEGSPFRLSDSDRELVLYNELNSGGYFTAFKSEDLACTRGMAAAWKTNYSLDTPRPPTATLPVAWKAKEARLNRLAKSWDYADPAYRKNELEEEIQGGVELSAPVDFIPQLAFADESGDSGLRTLRVNGAALAQRRKICFGNFKDPKTDEPWATAFARFEGDNQVYFVRATFRNDQAWGPEGPRIAALVIRPMVEADKAYQQNASCL